MDGKSISEVVHDLARGMHKAGTISDERMREYDAMCGQPPLEHYTPSQIKCIREQTETDQGTFTACLNISKATLQRWEQGQSEPHGASLRLLNVVKQKGLHALS